MFYNAIKKYGWENISHDIIANNITQTEACDIETSLIILLNSNNSNFGYNQDTGGNMNKILNDETRKKLSEAQPKFFGEANRNAKKVICLNTLQVFGSFADANEWVGFRRGSSLISNYCNGTINKLSIGKHPETGERLIWDFYVEGNNYTRTTAKLKNSANSKKVININTLIVYNSATHADIETGCNRLSISKCCRSEQDFAISRITNQNIKWEYYSDYLNKQDIKLYA